MSSYFSLVLHRFVSCQSYNFYCSPCKSSKVFFSNATHPRNLKFPRLLQAFLRRLPVDNVPDSTEVLCLAILILETVGTNSQLLCIHKCSNHDDIPRLTNMHAPTHQSPVAAGIAQRRDLGSVFIDQFLISLMTRSRWHTA